MSSKTWRLCLLLPLIAAGPIACGDSTTGPDSGRVGAAGGTFEFAEGAVTLVVPEDALSEAVTIRVDSATRFPTSPRLITGTAYRIEPAGTRFDRPVILEIGYDGTNVPATIGEEEARIHRLVEGDWNQISGSTVSTANRRVRASIDHLSTFAVLGAAVTAVRVRPDSVRIRVGETARLSAEPADMEGGVLRQRPVVWSSSDESVATVDSSGLVTGRAGGTSTISATSEGVTGTATVSVQPPPVSLTITSGPDTTRQGDVVVYTAEARDEAGEPVEPIDLSWSVSPNAAGLIVPDGRFVGYTPGPAQIVATASGLADTLGITIESRGLSGSFALTGRGPVTTRFTSDLWVHGNHAYTGTWGCRNGICGNRLLAWDVGDPTNPTLTDSVMVDATTVNDIKVRADGAIAVLTHEGSSDGGNGITLIDLSDPASPSIITRFTDELEPGVHNVWIDGNHVYAVVDGADPTIGGLRVIDIADPSNPSVVARFYGGSSFLHDVYVRSGLAFLSHWNAGLIILDVGAGGPPAAPTNPVELGRVQTEGGQTHNAWYWPATGYTFVGEEDFSTPGIMHVVDATDLTNPQEVASFRVPGAVDPPHNFWLDEDRAILYMAWYGEGIRALDVSGELLGELDRQGREIASEVYASDTQTWAPQLHDGLIFLSDLNSGLWVFSPSF